MEKTVLKVEGMSCQHCVKAVSGAVGALPGVEKVDVDLKKGLVTVTHDGALADAGKMKLAIEEAGYDVLS